MGNAMSEGSGGCPVKHDAAPASGASACPVIHTPSAPAAAASTSGCPVNHGAGGDKASTGASSSRARGVVYNVYAQPIDPKNQMPAVPNQQKAAGQDVELPTARVQSSIPKGGTDTTWLYPSPQMFWNALVRKHKADGVHETDMTTVVSIHNEMNERAWRKVAEWEELHKGEHLDGEPSLRRFMGKPYDLSPKAKVKSYLGYGFPFDRHDWFVDRNGKEVRYIIDYYFNAAPDADVALPIGSGPDALIPTYTKSIHVDVRPAVDDVTSAWDRIRRLPQRVAESMRVPRFKAEGLDPATAPKEAAAFALHSSEAPAAAASAPSAPLPATSAAPATDPVLAIVDNKCKPLLDKFKAAAGGADHHNAHVALNYCMATVLCPNEAATFMGILEKSGDAAGEERAFDAMSKCVLNQMITRRQGTGAPTVGGATLK